MPRRSHPPMSLQGQRALRKSSHDDYEPGLEILRWGTVLGGTALMTYGLMRRRRWTDLIYSGVGAALLYRGLSDINLVGRSIKRMMLHTGANREVEIATSMTVETPVDEVYRFWRRLDNLPRFLRHIETVETLDERHSRWTARLPAGMHLSWHAEIIEDRPDEVIAWQSVEGSDLFNEGFITFEPVFDGAGTEIHARIVYHPPAGRLGERLATFFENLQAMVVREDLRSFKRLIETGELPTVEGQPSARRGRANGRLQRLMG